MTPICPEELAEGLVWLQIIGFLAGFIFGFWAARYLRFRGESEEEIK